MSPQVERAVNEMRVELGNSSRGIGCFKNVGKNAADVFHGVSIRVNWNGAPLAKAERPHVVKPHHMIHVSVRENNGVQAFQFLAQHLPSKIGSRIDHHHPPIEFQQHRRPGSIVTWVSRSANAAMAGGKGNAGGGSRAQKR